MVATRMTRMTKRLLLAALAASLTAACEPVGPSRVASGQLYSAGEPTYDAYFRDVHQQQVDASTWPDERRAAHKSLVTALELTPDAPDVTLVQGSHDAASKAMKQGSLRLDIDGTNARTVATGGANDGGPLFRAIEEAAHAELERAKRLHALEPRLDALTKQGTDLEGRAPTDFKTRGPMRQKEISSELESSVTVLSDLKARASREARESEDFVADLERALETASEDRAAKPGKGRKPKKDKADKGDDDKPKATSKPSGEPKPAPEPKPQPEAKPAPPPKPADTGEVFTP
jgi:hypothetical protein